VPETPFDSLESAQTYIALLREAVGEAQEAIKEDIAESTGSGPVRHLDALRLVDHKLTQLGGQLRATGRILNDLRMLRRLLMGEGKEEAGDSQ
jgi:hypothetical protein